MIILQILFVIGKDQSPALERLCSDADCVLSSIRFLLFTSIWTLFLSVAYLVGECEMPRVGMTSSNYSLAESRCVTIRFPHCCVVILVLNCIPCSVPVPDMVVLVSWP